MDLPPSHDVARRARRRWSAPAWVLVPGVLVAGLAGCTGDDAAASSTPSSVVLQPGRPGEPATTVAPEDFVPDDSTAPRWNQADADFVTHMITHHLQALEMAELAVDRAEHEQVKAIASRIYDTQGAEIHGLAAWLAERDLPVPADVEQLDGSGPRAPGGGHAGHGDHGDHGDMPGMIGAEQMAALEAASGPQFDRLFLEAMIEHHEGAVDMAVTVLTSGEDLRTEELANDIGAGQAAEIARLQDILDAL
ncbi:DUF305 domain-containing protein [Isoptericola variabilis]|uniref:DUF305 domain-containing protein n=1 Tax=Isoptericola variabilis TaxID=139208 RepID=UPI001C8F35E8|nr:DUF305 domain-containing protein [Isoptericola variabilis]